MSGEGQIMLNMRPDSGVEARELIGGGIEENEPAYNLLPMTRSILGYLQ